MKVIFKTNIDKYKGKFPTDFQSVPRKGEFVAISDLRNTNLPFTELEVHKVTYEDKDTVVVELHLSELQHRQNKEYKLGVFE